MQIVEDEFQRAIQYKPSLQRKLWFFDVQRLYLQVPRFVESFETMMRECLNLLNVLPNFSVVS